MSHDISDNENEENNTLYVKNAILATKNTR